MQCPHNAFKVAVEVFKEKRGEGERQTEREGEKNLAKKVHLTQLLMLCRVSLTLSFPFLSCHHLLPLNDIQCHCP
jgi:hypothetical protein